MRVSALAHIKQAIFIGLKNLGFWGFVTMKPDRSGRIFTDQNFLLTLQVQWKMCQ